MPLKEKEDRSNTSSPASWYKNQKMYTPSVTNSENEEEQETSYNIKRAFNQEQEVYNEENQQIPITYDYSVTPNLLPSRSSKSSAYAKFKELVENKIQQRNEGIRALANESDDESLTKE
ncbi:55_t:CDS:2 [Dentiscutata heterogama]|uniref:55_t:CDS:1 n=1 Tax=Dentiscutata heterogama TaxID=1316150 RepID=A0ACA9NEE6_9GLOM|nr:55_t:CDS:2 [Dentiscutata heterogama]